MFFFFYGEGCEESTQLDRMTDLSRELFVARDKNFVKRNILHVKRSYPAEPKQRFVDTRYGNTHDLKSSGLLPIYVHKKVRVQYIIRIKKNSLIFPLFLTLVLYNYFAFFYLDTILKTTFSLRIMERYRNSLRLIEKPT